MAIRGCFTARKLPQPARPRRANLDRHSILAAVKAGRVWIAESAAVNLRLNASSGTGQAGIGDKPPLRAKGRAAPETMWDHPALTLSSRAFAALVTDLWVG
jgi:hypothetical protein